MKLQASIPIAKELYCTNIDFTLEEIGLETSHGTISHTDGSCMIITTEDDYFLEVTYDSFEMSDKLHNCDLERFEIVMDINQEDCLLKNENFHECEISKGLILYGKLHRKLLSII
jgi:hypothetical protein